jgi:membrane-associated phospholipid phosphatase
MYRKEAFKNYNRFINSLITILLLVMISSAYGEETKLLSTTVPALQPEAKVDANSGDVDLNKAYLKNYLTDTAHILTSPVRWDQRDWITASVVIGAAVGFYAWDKEIQTWVQDHRGETTDNMSRIFRPFGEGQYSLPALGLFYLYGQATKDSRAKKTALLGLETFLISGAFTQALKYTTHRCRPSDCSQYDSWNGPSFSNSNLSFVSGEAASVFSLATVIASEYEDKVWVPPVAYGIATLTALARLNNNAHWSSDVFLGAALGYLTAKAIIRLHKKKSNFAVIPMTDGQYCGFGLAGNF